MPLSDAERQACLNQVAALITDEFQQKFQELYSIAVATCGVHPEQVNNEMRNMLTHVARALSAETCDSVNKELELARGHLIRAQRDCLKLSNLHLYRMIKDDLGAIRMRDGPAFFPLKKRARMIEDLKAIQQGLVEARRAEVSGVETTLEALEKVNADLQEYRVNYLDDALVDGTPPHWATTLWLRAQEHWLGFVIGVAASLSAAAIWWVTVPGQ